MKSPEASRNDQRLLNLQVLAALKSGQAEAKGFDYAYFMDHEPMLEDEEVMNTVAEIYPYVIGHLRVLNKDPDFVRRWFSNIKNPEERKKVYRNARGNNLTISLEGL